MQFDGAYNKWQQLKDEKSEKKMIFGDLMQLYITTSHKFIKIICIVHSPLMQWNNSYAIGLYSNHLYQRLRC